jgi:hypothetical protein
VRADRAHAKILRIDTDKARALPGVLDIVTADDAVAAGWKGTPSTSFFRGVGGSALRVPFRGALARDRVRFVGEPVALVVAESETLAQDAAELIEIEYEDLPVVVEADEAMADGAVRLHEDLPDNLAFDYEYGDRASTEPGFAQAAHVVQVGLRVQRIAGNPMEPKSCVALYDAASGVFELCLPCQGAADIKSALAHITGFGPERFRIRSVDVGGAFGIRNEVYPEFLALMLAAKKTGRPVKWTGTRSETMSGDHHGRAADLAGELALDRDGRFLALRVRWLVNLGAYCSNCGAADQYDRLADQFGHQPLRRPGRARQASAGVHQHRRRPRPIAAPDVPTSPICGSAWSKRGRARSESSRSSFADATSAQGDVSVEDADRLDLRQRRSAAPAEHGVAGCRIGTASSSGGKPRSVRASCAASGLLCFSSRPAAWARSRSSCGSSRWATSRCFRSRVLRARARNRVPGAGGADPGRVPRTGSSLRYNDVDAPKLVGVGHIRIAVPDQPRRRARRPAPRRWSRRAASSPRREFEVEAGDVGLRRTASTASWAPTCPSACRR